jgi:hypothetical protein
VYGQPVKKLKNVVFGVQVYVFANQMQIKLLPTELDKLLKDTKAADIFAIFDLYHMIDNQTRLEFCKQVNY